jgi:hypothetical protein
MGSSLALAARRRRLLLVREQGVGWRLRRVLTVSRPVGAGGPFRSLNDFDVLTADNVLVESFSETRSVQTRFAQRQPLPDNLSIRLSAFGTTVHFELTVNEDLFHPNAELHVRVCMHSGGSGHAVRLTVSVAYARRARVCVCVCSTRTNMAAWWWRARRSTFTSRPRPVDLASERGPWTHTGGRARRGGATSPTLGSGWARLTVVAHEDGGHTVTGVFTLNDVLYNIESPQQFDRADTHVRRRCCCPSVAHL